MAGAQLLVAHVVAEPLAVAPELLGAPGVGVDDVEVDLFPSVVEALCGSCVEWRFVVVSGNPARQLLRLAEDHHAAAIVIGADTPGWVAHVRRFASGTVPAHLVHRQRVPVVVVPEACQRRRAQSSITNPSNGAGHGLSS